MDEDSVTDTAVAMDESSEINPHQSNPVESDAPAADEASRLVALDTHVRNQDDLERDITRQADRMLLEQEDERDSKRLDRTRREKE